MGTLSFDPLIPPAVWLSLAALAAALLAWYGWRRPPGVSARRWAAALALMAAGLALVLSILLNPTWVEPLAPPAGKPLLTVLVDGTASMATPDGPGGQTRYRAAARLAREFGKQAGGRFEVRVSTFAAAPTPADLDGLEDHPPDGPLTDLAAAVVGGIEEDRPQGQALVLLSDGIHNAGGGSARVLEAVRTARAMACPVYTRTFGGETEVKDLAVEWRSPQELAYVGQKVPATVLLRQHGLGGGLATLVLSHAGKELERRAVRLPPGGTAEARFQVSQEKTGLYRYEVRAEPLPGEVSLVNNMAVLLLRVVDEPIRVLLLEGKPYWDGKFLLRTLLGDASIELDSVVRVGEGRFHRRTLSRGKGPAGGPAREEWKVLTGPPELLANEESLRSYQVVVLGRDAEVFLTDAVLGYLRTWLARDGGCLVCYRGQPMAQVNQRLGQLLPLEWAPARESRFRVHLTERGRDLRWFSGEQGPEGQELTGLPTLATTSRAERPKPLAVVLATAQTAVEGETPVVSYQPYGTGRVVVIEGSGMWRWAFLPPQQQAHDEVYRALWHSLVRWLVSSADLLPGQKLALRSDRVSFGTTEAATATLLLREEAARGQAPAVELRGGEGGPKTFTPVPVGSEPGTFRVAFGRLPEGRYEARVAGAAEADPAASAAFDVRSFFEEQLDLKSRPDLMARIAQDSGGAVLEGDGAAEIIGRFQEHVDRSRPAHVRRLSAWDRWWVLLGVFAVWVAAWAVRRSGGLV